jgi:hypothetical protein
MFAVSHSGGDSPVLHTRLPLHEYVGCRSEPPTMQACPEPPEAGLHPGPTRSEPRREARSDTTTKADVAAGREIFMRASYHRGLVVCHLGKQP